MNTSLSSMGWRNQSPSGTFNNQSMNTSIPLNMSASYTYKSKQQDIIMSDRGQYILEQFGAPLPAMIRSLLNKQATEGTVKNITTRMDPNGWAWLVQGCHLYVWRHSFGHESKRNNVIPCRELILPTSELDHQAQLVCVVATGSGSGGSSSSSPACIAVSPEGQITYWPNISNDSGTITISADIPGQECESLYSLWPQACILTTTTSTILLIKPCVAGGNKPSLVCSPVILAKGWLGGLGRKMSNMLFNPIPIHAGGDTKRAKIAIPISKDDPSQPGNRNPVIYILHGSTLQAWSMAANQQLMHLSSMSLDTQIRHFFLESAWSATAATHKLDQLRRIQVLSLDVDILPNLDVVVLVAAFDSTENNPVIHYGIVKMNPRESGSEVFIPVEYTTPYESVEDDSRNSELHSWRVVATSNYYCMINKDNIVLTTEHNTDEESDIIAAASCGGPYLGFGCITDNTVVVFGPKYGILSLKLHLVDNLLDNQMTENIRVPENLMADITQYNFSDAMQSDDNVNRLKLAFLAFIGKRTTECENLIQTVFPSSGLEWTPYESIDLIVLNLCEKLINDAPAPDPRGGGSYGSAMEPDLLGYRAKQLIHKCLNSKKEAMELYLGFLSNVKLLQQLTRVVVKEDILATASILYNYYEKTGLAMAVFQLLTDPQYHDFVEAAIKMVVQYRSERDVQVRASHLSTNEQFFKDISMMHHFVKGIVIYEEGLLNSAMPAEMPEIVCKTNDVLLRALVEIGVQLQEKISAVKSSLITPLEESPNNPYELRHWLVDPSTLQYLRKQHSIIVTNGLKVTDDAGIKIKLLKELQDFTDIILGGLERNLSSVRGSSRYNQKKKFFEDTRHELLRQFVSLRDYERALGLAEKYQDFDIIISTCVEREEYEKLEYYFTKYESNNFPELTFEWFVKQKKHNDLLTRFVNSVAREKLRNFLRGYPEMLWHFETKLGEVRNAANTLRTLANSDTMDPEDRLLFLRLSKLGMLASGVPAEEVDAMKEYDACNEGAVDIDLLSNMSINERSEFSSVSQ